MIHEIHGTHSPLLTEHHETPQRVAAIAGEKRLRSVVLFQRG